MGYARPMQHFSLARRRIPQEPWRATDPRDLAPTRPVPTMLAGPEQRLYHWLTASWARGAGEIVELGCFAGGSTARLAQGHKRAGLASRIHAYDRFQINEAGKKAHLYPAGIPEFSGQDLLPLAERLLAPWASRITLHPGPIEAQSWPGEAIELLVMDASKSRATADRFAEMFFPALIPGHSLVVQQDYLHWKLPWIAAQMELMAGCFTPVAHAPHHTVVFRCEAPVNARVLQRGRVSGLSQARMLKLLRQARGRLRPLGLGERITDLIRSARANPGIERASEMVRPGRM